MRRAGRAVARGGMVGGRPAHKPLTARAHGRRSAITGGVCADLSRPRTNVVSTVARRIGRHRRPNKY